VAWTSLSVESPAVKSSTADSIQIWIASFLRYLELRLELLGLEARKAGVHLLIISLLLTGTLICFAGFLILLIVFLLYFMTLILHWPWGWCALLLAAGLFVIGIVTGITLRPS
jgi:Putative Actinobacterial Holin-X, holin superfamily III